MGVAVMALAVVTSACASAAPDESAPTSTGSTSTVTTTTTQPAWPASACESAVDPLADLRRLLLESPEGQADYEGYPVADIPKANAALVMAEARCLLANPDHDRTLLEERGDRLLDWPVTYPSDRFGWGLPFAWDAFGDGTVNPDNTVYAISTGLVVKALLDWREVASDPERVRIDRVVGAALDEWTDVDSRTEGGQLLYSLSGFDDELSVYNASVQLAGQLQRFATIAPVSRARRYSAVADVVFDALVDDHRVDDDGHWYWSYSDRENTPNDMTHAGYIIDGVLTYVTHGGVLSDELPVDLIFEHVEYAFRPEEGQAPELLLPWPAWRDEELFRSHWRLLRLYEVGWTLHLTGEYPFDLRRLRAALCSIGRRHRTEDGHWLKDATDIEVEVHNPEIYEYLAYFYLGLVSVGAEACAA